LGAPASEFYGLVSSALGQAMAGGTRDLQAEEMTASGTLIPPNISSNAEKMTYIATQRERLRVLMSAFDKEANNLASSREQAMQADVDKRMRGLNAAGMSYDDGLRKSKSELEFEPIEHEDIGAERHGNTPGGSGGSWMPWSWSGKPNTAQQSPEVDRGASSGVEPRY
jgi:receptor expression-enhancing protein 1/2/3/4